MTELVSLSSVTLELDKVAPFLIKLFEIVSSPPSDYLICWSEHGDSFRIIDRTKFAQVSVWPGLARRSHAATMVCASHTATASVRQARAAHRKNSCALAASVHSRLLPHSLHAVCAGHSAAVLQARQPALLYQAAEHLWLPAGTKRVRVRCVALSTSTERLVPSFPSIHTLLPLTPHAPASSRSASQARSHDGVPTRDVHTRRRAQPQGDQTRRPVQEARPRWWLRPTRA